MYDPRQLYRIASMGLADMLPSLRQAFATVRASERLEPIYGPNPRATVLLLPVLLAALGEWFARQGPRLPFSEYLDWPVIFVGLVFALLVRRFLFRARPEAGDFPWLAASLIPPVLICLLVSALFWLVAGPAPAPDRGAAYSSTLFGQLLMTVTHELGLVAAYTVALAALCYSREWPRALMDLAVRLLVFRIMIWVTALVLIEIGIIGRLLGVLLNLLFGWSLPEWMKVLADQLSYASLLTVAYLAIIGGTWSVCRTSFPALLESGHVDILSQLEQLATADPQEKQAAPGTPD